MTIEAVLRLATVGVLVYGALAGCVFVAQESLVYFPGREITTTPAARGLPFDDVAIHADDGETLHAWWIPAAAPRGTALLFHGNAGNISHRLDYAVMFRALGYNTLLVDYRGYGKSTGTPSEEGTYRDAEASWLWLRARGIAEREIVVYGESLGGGVASWLAARHAPRALVLASSFSSVPDLGAQIYPFLPVRLMSRFQYDTLERLPDVNAPVLVIHSPGDDVIPFSHGKKLFAAAREPKAFLEIAGGHNSGFVFTRTEWVRALEAFLEKSAKDTGR